MGQGIYEYKTGQNIEEYLMTYIYKKRLFYNAVLTCILVDEFVKLYLSRPDKTSTLFLLGIIVDTVGKWMIAKTANKMFS